MSRRCHTVTVDAHEKLLLQLYRTVSPITRMVIDRLLWEKWIHPINAVEGKAAIKRWKAAGRSLNTGTLGADALMAFSGGAR